MRKPLSLLTVAVAALALTTAAHAETLTGFFCYAAQVCNARCNAADLLELTLCDVCYEVGEGCFTCAWIGGFVVANQ